MKRSLAAAHGGSLTAKSQVWFRTQDWVVGYCTNARHSCLQRTSSGPVFSLRKLGTLQHASLLKNDENSGVAPPTGRGYINVNDVAKIVPNPLGLLHVRPYVGANSAHKDTVSRCNALIAPMPRSRPPPLM
jgi:hypothetical protein